MEGSHQQNPSTPSDEILVPLLYLGVPHSLVGVSSTPDVHPCPHDGGTVPRSGTGSLLALLHLLVRGTHLPRHGICGNDIHRGRGCGLGWLTYLDTFRTEGSVLISEVP